MLNKQTKQNEPKITTEYRYFCHACTGRAFYANEAKSWAGVKTCNNCGAQLYYEADKWIKNEN